MWNMRLKKLVIFTGLFFQPIVSPTSFAFAKRRSPPKAFSFFSEGGKASQGECDGERKIPRKLKHLKEYAKAGSYIGSAIQTFEIKGKIDLEMWKHFFSAKSSCNAVLAKTPSSAEKNLKGPISELPPDDPVDSEDDDQTEGKMGAPNESPAEAPASSTK